MKLFLLFGFAGFDSGPFLFFLLVEFVVGFSIGLCSLAAGFVSYGLGS